MVVLFVGVDDEVDVDAVWKIVEVFEGDICGKFVSIDEFIGGIEGLVGKAVVGGGGIADFVVVVGAAVLVVVVG